MSEVHLPLQAMRGNAERALERWEKARCTAEDSSSCERCSRVASARWVLRITDLFPDVRGVDQLLRIEVIDPTVRDMSYRSELIQVAAVVVSMIEDHDQEQAFVGIHTLKILDEIEDERDAQDEKWGPQHHDPPMWLTILMEEVGEAAQAYLHEVEATYTPPEETDGVLKHHHDCDEVGCFDRPEEIVETP